MGMLGTLALYGALVAIAVTVVSGVQAARTGNSGSVRLAERGMYGLAAFASLAVLVLQLALVTLDFGLKYVGEYTSSTLSVPYRIGSMWAGQGGSLLLWGWIVSLTGAWTVYATKRRGIDVSTWVYVAFAASALLFMGMVAFLQSPFVPQTEALADGAGLNPLLQDPLQLIHPLFLYGGYVLYTVPFAIVFGSIVAGRVTGPWIEFARLWAVISWISLTIGMVLGARWAYAELGWGGYWAWDPVENASLIPWLSGTALLHAGLSQRGDRERLRLSSVVLLAATFNLCLFGTFLTRSGVIQSVHAFGESNVGPVLGGAIVAFVLASGAVIVWRLPMLKHEDAKQHSWGWLGQRVLALLLILMTLAVLWGTLYPLFARAFLNQEVAVSPGFFKAVVSPMGVGLLLLLAVSPFLPNQRAADVQREAAVRGVLFVLVAGATFVLGGTWIVAGVLGLAVLSIKTILWKARPKLGVAMQEQEERAWAVAHAGSPYLAHMGLVILLAAITLNVTYEVKQQVKLEVGKSATVAGQSIRLDTARLVDYPDRQQLEATVSLLDADGAPTSALDVSVAAFNNSDQPHTQVGILSGLTRDVYIVIDGWPDDITAGIAWLRLTVYDNPAINWVWFGGGIMGIAGILYAMPMRLRRRQMVVPEAMTDIDAELDHLIHTAIVAVRADIHETNNERVNSLIRAARDLSGGDLAPTDQVVAFLERARRTATEPAAVVPPQPSGWSRNKSIGIGLFALVVVGSGAYLAGHMNGSAIPGITGTPTNTAAASTVAVDQAQVAALMEKITADPKDAESYAQLGALYYNAGSDASNSGDQATAVDYFAKASGFFDTRAKLAPKEVNAWLDAGAAALASNQREKAFSALTKALEIDPNSQLAHFDLGIWYLNADPAQSDKATAEFEKVVAIDPNSDIGQTAAQHIGVSAPSNGK